jgi:hypothetical protein
VGTVVSSVVCANGGGSGSEQARGVDALTVIPGRAWHGSTRIRSGYLPAGSVSPGVRTVSATDIGVQVWMVSAGLSTVSAGVPGYMCLFNFCKSIYSISITSALCFPFLFLRASIIEVMVCKLGMSGVCDQDPMATWARKVWNETPCCR